MDNDWIFLRVKRNKLLEKTDFTQLADCPINTELRTLYREYRQYLRDCPKLFNEETIKNAKVKTFEEWREWKRNGTY